MFNEMIKKTGNYEVYADLNENSLDDRTHGLDAMDTPVTVTGQVHIYDDRDDLSDYVDFSYNTGTDEFKVGPEGFYTNPFYRNNVRNNGGIAYMPSDMDDEAKDALKEALKPELLEWARKELKISVELDPEHIDFSDEGHVRGDFLARNENGREDAVLFDFDLEYETIEFDSMDGISYEPTYIMRAFDEVTDQVRTAVENAIAEYHVEFEPDQVEFNYDMQDVSKDYGRSVTEPMVIAGTLTAVGYKPEIGEDKLRRLEQAVDFTYDMKNESFKLHPYHSVTYHGNGIVNHDPIPQELNEPEVIESFKEAFKDEIEYWARNEMDVTITDITVDLSEPGYAAGAFAAKNGNMTFDDPDVVSYEYNINEGTIEFGNNKMGPAPQYIYANFEDIETQVKDAVILEQDRVLKERDGINIEDAFQKFDPDYSHDSAYVFMHTSDSVTIATIDPWAEDPRNNSGSTLIAFDNGRIADESPDSPVVESLKEWAQYFGIDDKTIDETLNNPDNEYEPNVNDADLIEKIIEAAEGKGKVALPVMIIKDSITSNTFVAPDFLPNAYNPNALAGFAFADASDYTKDDLRNEVDDYQAYLDGHVYTAQVYDIKDGKINLDEIQDFGTVYGIASIEMYENPDFFLGEFDSAEKAKAELDGPKLEAAQKAVEKKLEERIQNTQNKKNEHNEKKNEKDVEKTVDKDKDTGRDTD